MTYTDDQLRRTLAKLLPEQIVWLPKCKLEWRTTIKPERTTVLDTELLRLCWFVEEGLLPAQWGQYTENLAAETEVVDWGYYPGEASIDWDAIYSIVHATWQQRTVALARVNGVEIV